MPELAEVEFYKRQWEAATGEAVQSVSAHWENRVFRNCDVGSVAKNLPKTRFLEAQAHGKQMLFRFGERGWLGVHLGMAGKLFYHPSHHFESHKHDHLVLFLSKGTLVFRDTRFFGRILWHCGCVEPDWWASRGPDIAGENYTENEFRDVLERRSRPPLKSLLLDQQHFPGIGNWMADEILWRAAIHPCRNAKSLTREEIALLFHSLREVCADAMRVIAPDWADPPDSWLFPHRWRDGGICPRTGCALKRIQVGGRTTCFSPARQGDSTQPSRSRNVS